MTEKEKLLKYIIERPASATSRMSYYAINETFTIVDVFGMRFLYLLSNLK